MKYIITIVLCMFVSSVYAGDGNYLKDTCIEAEKLWSGERGDKAEGAYCIGLLKGISSVLVINANSSANKAKKRFGICNKEKPQHFITIEKSIGAVLKFLYSNPDKLNQQDFNLVMQALKKEFPCVE